MRRFTVSGLAVDSGTRAPVVLLRELDGEHVLPIWIGPAEANAIALKLGDVEPPRPMTHDLLQQVVEGAGYILQRVIISDLKDHTYFAELILEGEGTVVKVDARPSDSIALALRTESPIYVSDNVYLKEFGEDPTDESGRYDRLRARLKRIDPGEFGDESPR